MFSGLFNLFSNLIHMVLGITPPQKFPPPLPSDKERDCFKKFLETRDEEARQLLILHNLRLVSHIVRKYYSSSPNGEDLVSVGTVGLCKAVDSFSPANGTRFATYAAKCIQNEILMYFRSQKKLACEVSLNETIDIDRDGNPLTYIDVICCEENVVADVERKIRTQKALGFVKTVLNPRERQIIVMRYGLAGRKALTQRETAERLGISRSYVSRIEKCALEKLHKAFES